MSLQQAGSLAGGVAGFLIGGPLGAASLGFALGSLAGGVAGQLLQGPEQFRNEGSIPPDVTFTQSTQGSVIKKLYGTAKLAGNIIHFNQENRKVTTKTRQSGKGLGGGATTTNVSYEKIVDLVIAVCEGPAELLEIWVNGELEYSDISGQAGTNLGTWRWYTGTETQNIDSGAQGIWGVDKVPAYRGVSYLVMTGWNLASFGNSLPNLRFTVSNAASNQVYDFDTIPQVNLIPEGYSRPTTGNGTVIRNKLDGTGYYYILTKSGNFHLAEYSHATRSVISIGPAWVFPSPVGERVNNISLVPQTIGTGSFSWDNNFDVDDEYIYVAGTLTGLDVSPFISGYLVALNRASGTGRYAKQTNGVLLDIGLSQTRDACVQVTPFPIQGKRIVWASNRVDQEANGVGRFSLNALSVQAILLTSSKFELVKMWTPTEMVTGQPFSIYIQDALGVMDPEFDEGNLSWHYYKVGLASTNENAILMRASIKFPFEPVGPETVADNSFASQSATEISNWFTFSFAGNQYDNAIMLDSRNKTLLMHMGRHEALGGFGNLPTWVLIDINAATVLGTKSSNELSAEFGADYDALGTTNFTTQMAAEPVYDPQGNFWITTPNLSQFSAIRISSTDITDLDYYNPALWVPASNGFTSYDWRRRGIFYRRNSFASDYFLKLSIRQPGQTTIKKIVDDILLNKVGLQPSQIDTTDLDGLDALPDFGGLEGYIIAKPTTAREAIDPLATAFGFYYIESEGKLKFKRKYGRTPIVINPNDFGASENSDADIFEETVNQITGIPSSVTLNYIDPDFDYQQASQRSNRRTAPNENNVAVDSPIVMRSPAAKSITDRILFEENQNRRGITINVPIYGQTDVEYLGLEPGDLIQITYTDDYYTQSGEKYEVVETRSGGVLMTIIARRFEDAFYNTLTAQNYTPSSGIILPVKNADPTYPPSWIFVDCPSLRVADSGLGWYAAADNVNSTNNFRGVDVFRRTGTEYDLVITHNERATLGRITVALPAYPWNNWDLANTVTVQLNNQSTVLSSYSEEQVLAGDGAVLIGTEDQNWELIQYSEAEELGNGLWRLSKLLRNRRGTRDSFTSGSHSAFSNAIFVPSTGVGIFRPGDTTNSLNTPIDYRAVGAGLNISNSPQEFHVWSAASSKPRSPSSLNASRLGGNIVINWIRNDRLREGWDNFIDLANSEAIEQYEVQVTDNTITNVFSVLNTTTLTISDVYSTNVTITIAQLSVDVGVGYTSTLTI